MGRLNKEYLPENLIDSANTNLVLAKEIIYNDTANPNSQIIKTRDDFTLPETDDNAFHFSYEYFDGFGRSILKKIELSIPATLIDGEKMRMLSELKSSIENMGLKWEDYLAHLKKKEEEILNGWSDEAEKRCKYGLLLRKLADELKIDVSDTEIEERIAVSRVEEGIAQERLKDYIYGIIKNEKTFNFLELC